MLEQGDLIILSNKKEYIVIKQIRFEEKEYIYLISKDGISNMLVGLLENENLTIIKEEELLQKLLQKFKESK